MGRHFRKHRSLDVLGEQTSGNLRSPWWRVLASIEKWHGIILQKKKMSASPFGRKDQNGKDVPIMDGAESAAHHVEHATWC